MEITRDSSVASREVLCADLVCGSSASMPSDNQMILWNLIYLQFFWVFMVSDSPLIQSTAFHHTHHSPFLSNSLPLSFLLLPFFSLTSSLPFFFYTIFVSISLPCLPSHSGSVSSRSTAWSVCRRAGHAQSVIQFSLFYEVTARYFFIESTFRYLISLFSICYLHLRSRVASLISRCL